MHILVVVKPHSKQALGLVRQSDGSFVLHTNELPVNGRANAVAIAAIAKHFGVTRASVRLVRGRKARQKMFEVRTA